MTRVIIYCRTSGNDEERDSMSNQEMECLNYAASKGYEVVGTLRENVKGVSGYDFNAPELQKAIELAEQRVYDILLCRDMSRFSRDNLKAQLTEMQLKQYEVTVEFVWQQFSRNLDGEFFKKLQSLIDEKRGQEINKQMLHGRRNQVQFRNSAMFHGHPPLGYKAEKFDGRFVAKIVEEEEQIVKLIFKLYVEDKWSLGAIARKLNKDNVPTYSQLRGSTSFGDENSEWEGTTIRQILMNTAYIGKWYYGKRSRKSSTKIKDGRIVTVKENIYHGDENLILVNIPLIIDCVTFETAQRRLEENKQFSGRKSNHNFFLGKRVWCECGKKVVSETRKWEGKQYAYYVVCKNCGNRKYFRSDLIDELAWEWLRSIIKDKEKLQAKIEDYALEIEKSLEPIYKRLSYLQKLRAEREPKYKKLLDKWFELDDFDKDIALPQKELLKKELQDISSETEKLEEQRLELEYLKAEFLSGWDTISAEVWVDQQNVMADWFLEELENNFESKYDYVRKYDVKGTVLVEGGVYWLHLTCRFDETLLKLCDNYKSSTQKPQKGFCLVFSDKLLIDFNELARLRQEYHNYSLVSTS